MQSSPELISCKYQTVEAPMRTAIELGDLCIVALPADVPKKVIEHPVYGVSGTILPFPSSPGGDNRWVDKNCCFGRRENKPEQRLRTAARRETANEQREKNIANMAPIK